MGSGCNSSPSIFGSLTPDKRVQYTGPAIPSLNICTNDYLSEVEAVILQKLVDYSTGVGISIPAIDFTTCAAFTSCVTCCGSCTDLPCLLECYFNTICTIFNDVTTLQQEIGPLLDGTLNVECLFRSSPPTNPSLFTVIQELITEYCELYTQVQTLQTTVDDLGTGFGTQIGNFLLNALNTCQGAGTVVASGAGASAAISFKGFVPIGAIIPYAGPTAGKFDSTGLGLSGSDTCGFALCNGNNGTVDMRELAAIGVGAGAMGGGTLSPVASGANYSLNQAVGVASFSISEGQLPSVTQSIDFGSNTHQHQTVDALSDTIQFDGGAADYVAYGNTGSGRTPASTGGLYSMTGPSTMNISGSISFGGNQPISVVQPSRALYYIQRIA